MLLYVSETLHGDPCRATLLLFVPYSALQFDFFHDNNRDDDTCGYIRFPFVLRSTDSTVLMLSSLTLSQGRHIMFPFAKQSCQCTKVLISLF